MAGKLYALGRWAARRRRWVVAGRLLLLAVVGGLGITLHGNLSPLAYSRPMSRPTLAA